MAVPSTRRQSLKAATRAHLLKAARDLFTTLSYEAVTVRMVAKFAGRSTGAIFAHWPDKDTLFTEAMGRPPFTDAMGERLYDELVRRLHETEVVAPRLVALNIAQGKL